MPEYRMKVAPDTVAYADGESHKFVVEFSISGATMETIDVKVLQESIHLTAPARDIEYVAALALGRAVRPDKAEASYEHGLLRIEVPFKDPMDDAVKVTVKAGSAKTKHKTIAAEVATPTPAGASGKQVGCQGLVNRTNRQAPCATPAQQFEDRNHPREVPRLSMKHRLLIADREVEWRELLQKFLADWGYEVETSTDGLDCVAKLRDAAPEMLVLDLELPWGGGDGVLAWLREESSAPKIPVLLIGPEAAPPDLTEFNEQSIVGYLPKPLGLTYLLKSIRSTFARTEPVEKTIEHRSHSSLFRALNSSDHKGYCR